MKTDYDRVKGLETEKAEMKQTSTFKDMVLVGVTGLAIGLGVGLLAVVKSSIGSIGK